MSLVTFIFYFFVLTTATSAIGILLSKNVFKAALFLLTCLLSVAAIYVLSFAEFVAITQILIYAGGVLVVIIFGVMLTTKISGKPLRVTNAHIFSGLLAASTLFAILIIYIPADLVLPAANRIDTTENIRNIGINFMTAFSLPFELAGILLLVALIGAAVISSFAKSKKM